MSQAQCRQLADQLARAERSVAAQEDQSRAMMAAATKRAALQGAQSCANDLEGHHLCSRPQSAKQAGQRRVYTHIHSHSISTGGRCLSLRQVWHHSYKATIG
jgi:hypothetical protein